MEKCIAILQKLFELTKSRDKKWAPTNILDQYSINLGKGKVTIEYNRPTDSPIGNPFAPNYEYCAVFFNEKGTAIDRLEVTSFDTNKNEYRILAQLWKEVEDSYQGKNETIDSMMEELGIS